MMADAEHESGDPCHGTRRSRVRRYKIMDDEAGSGDLDLEDLGEAVGAGTVMAAELSRRLGWLTDAEFERTANGFDGPAFVGAESRRAKPYPR